jgi:hypothetical protein
LSDTRSNNRLSIFKKWTCFYDWGKIRSELSRRRSRKEGSAEDVLWVIVIYWDYGWLYKEWSVTPITNPNNIPDLRNICLIIWKGHLGTISISGCAYKIFPPVLSAGFSDVKNKPIIINITALNTLTIITLMMIMMMKMMIIIIIIN